jgi:multicomponent Na+:H+ antiporter subunit E
MTLFLWNILLALAWIFITETFSAGNIVLGFILGYLILWICKRALTPSSYFHKIRQVVNFALFFLWELIKANLRVAYNVVAPLSYLRPGVVAVPLDAKTDIEITFLANLITLTPGSFSLDVSDDGRILFIHTVYVDDPDRFRQEIKDGFEKRLLEVLR